MGPQAGKARLERVRNVIWWLANSTEDWGLETDTDLTVIKRDRDLRLRSHSIVGQIPVPSLLGPLISGLEALPVSSPSEKFNFWSWHTIGSQYS